MDISYLTEAGPGRVNEDYACAGPHWAIVLDGATAQPSMDSGCTHDVPWLVHHMAAALTERLILSRQGSLADVLAEAIKQTCGAHAETCDLTNPDSPSTTVTMFRAEGDRVDCLTLGDFPLSSGTTTARSAWSRTAGPTTCPAGGPTASNWCAAGATGKVVSGSPASTPMPPTTP